MNVRRNTSAWIPCLLAAYVARLAHGGSNFTAHDPEFVRVAELSRRQSAVFWSGADLPGPWFRPCAITVRLNSGPASGSTSFVFDRGEVSGWRMTLSGRRDELLADVLPHEVDHMVRASLVRRPIPRWLDEGCAVIRESATGRQRFRERLARYRHTVVDAVFLDRMDYPDDCQEIDRVYTVGASLVEYLLENGDPPRLLAFQQDERAPSRKLGDYYGLSIDELNRNWQLWLTEELDTARAQDDSRSAPEASAPAAAIDTPLPTLTIYTSEACGPCRRFWNDFETEPSFRATLTSQVRILRIDIDLASQAATDSGIREVPTFVFNNRTVTGYEGAEWLLREIGLSPATRLAGPTDGALPKPPAAVSQTLSPKPRSRGSETGISRGGKLVDAALRAAPIAFTTLELLGIIGGSAATGGVGGIVLSLALAAVRRRLAQRRRSGPQAPASTGSPPTGGGAGPPAPFPRELDEAGELVALRQSEGRVAVLDALRGMFLDDELEKLMHTSDAPSRAVAQRLRESIDRRIDEVAPLSTRSATPSTFDSG